MVKCVIFEAKVDSFSWKSLSFFDNSSYFKFPKGLRDPWRSLGDPFGVQGGQARSVERSRGPREVPKVSQGGFRKSSFSFLLEVNLLTV